MTAIEDQYLVISAEFSTHLDMLLANAFNMDKASVLARTIVVDDFEKFTGEGANNGRKPVAFLISAKSIINKDKLVHMEAIRNPRKYDLQLFLPSPLHDKPFTFLKTFISGMLRKPKG